LWPVLRLAAVVAAVASGWLLTVLALRLYARRALRAVTLPPGECRVWTVTGLRLREHADTMRMYPTPVRGRQRPAQAPAAGRGVGA